MNKPEIYFFSENIKFTLKHKRKIKKWIVESILCENSNAGSINFIFCNDKYLIKINKTYLNKDTLTDVIAFNYCENNVISGDIYISYERIKENAKKFNLHIENELLRVMIHGILHLIGYKDKSAQEKLEIRMKEDSYINEFRIAN